MPMNTADDWEDVELDDWEDSDIEIPKKPGASELDQYAYNPPLAEAEKYVGPAREFGKKALGAIGTASEFIDRYTGAPVRAAVGAAIDQKPGDKPFWEAGFSQFGEPSEKAPSGKDIAAKLGVPTKEFSTGLVLDPFRGETLKASPAGIAGAIGETVMDPTVIASAAGKLPLVFAAGKVPLESAKATSWLAGKTSDLATRGFGKVAFGIPTHQTKEFIKSPWEARQMAKEFPTERLESKIVGDVASIRGEVDKAEMQRQRLKDYLDDRYKQRKLDIKQRSVPVDVVRNVQGQMENEKAILGQMSAQADDVLEKSGVKFQRDHLIRLIDQIGQGEGKYIVGDAASDAMQKLMKTKERLQSLPNTIDGPLLRDVMRQIRDDIDFGMQSGEFNSRLNRMRKAFSERVSGVLKEQVPEYADLMQEMSARSQSLQKMVDVFGTEAKGIGTLSTIKGGSAKSPILDETLREFSGRTGNQELPKILDQYKSDIELSDAMQRADMKPWMFLQDYSNLQQAENALDTAKERFNKVRPITESRTQAVINQQQAPSGGRLYDRRALESLEEMTGTPYNDIIQKSGAYRAFDKDATRGSRLTNLGALLGGSVGASTFGGIGGAIGTGLGGSLGFAADRLGAPALRAGISAAVPVKRTFDKALSMIGSNPLFDSKYGRVLKESIDRGGIPAAQLYHNLLMNNDPEYRKLFEGEQ